MPSADRNLEPNQAPAESSVPGVPADTKNFRRVTEWLFRGGHPGADGIKFLQTLGIRTVISLRWNPWAVAEERQMIEALGMTYVSIPLSYWSWPSERDVGKFLSIIDDPESRPVFIHCLHGSDRTGMLVAMYRMAREGWDVDKAYREMRACGFHRLPVYHFKWAVYLYARKLAEAAKKQR